MRIRRILTLLALLAILLPARGLAQQEREPPAIDAEDIRGMHHLDKIYYEKDRKEQYIEKLERDRRMREMESWDNQGRLTDRKLLDIECTWKRPGGKDVTKVFKKRIAPTCEAAVEELARDLNRPLSADCACKNVSPTAEAP